MDEMIPSHILNNAICSICEYEKNVQNECNETSKWLGGRCTVQLNRNLCSIHMHFTTLSSDFMRSLHFFLSCFDDSFKNDVKIAN